MRNDDREAFNEAFKLRSDLNPVDYDIAFIGWQAATAAARKPVDLEGVRQVILLARTTLERKLQASDYAKEEGDPALYAQAAYICEDINEFIHLAHSWCEKAEKKIEQANDSLIVACEQTLEDMKP